MKRNLISIDIDFGLGSFLIPGLMAAMIIGIVNYHYSSPFLDVIFFSESIGIPF